MGDSILRVIMGRAPISRTYLISGIINQNTIYFMFYLHYFINILPNTMIDFVKSKYNKKTS